MCCCGAPCVVAIGVLVLGCYLLYISAGISHCVGRMFDTFVASSFLPDSLFIQISQDHESDGNLNSYPFAMSCHSTYIKIRGSFALHFFTELTNRGEAETKCLTANIVYGYLFYLQTHTSPVATIMTKCVNKCRLRMHRRLLFRLHEGVGSRRS